MNHLTHCHLMWLIFSIVVASLTLGASQAGATDLPLPDHGVSVAGVGFSASTTRISGYYSRQIGATAGWTGLRYAPGPRAVALPVGASRSVVTSGRYALAPRVQLAPMLLFRDDFDAAIEGRIGIDNRWIGDRLGAYIGLDVDAAMAFNASLDRRVQPGVVAGLGHRFERGDAWVFGRTGYTFSGPGAGTLAYELGLAIGVPF